MEQKEANGFRANTVAQFKIGIWLDEMGISAEDLWALEPTAPNEVRVVNTIGQCMVVRWEDDHARIIPRAR